MTKLILFTALVVALASCSGSGSTDNNTKNEKEVSSNPTAIDTVRHPDGIINGSVISTDTAAMNMQNSINKAKEAKKD